MYLQFINFFITVLNPITETRLILPYKRIILSIPTKLNYGSFTRSLARFKR